MLCSKAPVGTTEPPSAQATVSGIAKTQCLLTAAVEEAAGTAALLPASGTLLLLLLSLGAGASATRAGSSAWWGQGRSGRQTQS